MNLAGTFGYSTNVSNIIQWQVCHMLRSLYPWSLWKQLLRKGVSKLN